MYRICTYFFHALIIFGNYNSQHILSANFPKKHLLNVTAKLEFRPNVNRENGERERGNSS